MQVFISFVLITDWSGGDFNFFYCAPTQTQQERLLRKINQEIFHSALEFFIDFFYCGIKLRLVLHHNRNFVLQRETLNFLCAEVKNRKRGKFLRPISLDAFSAFKLPYRNEIES